MAEPSQGLEFVEWVKLVGTAVATAVGSVWAWWKSVKKAIYGRVTRLEQEMSVSIEELRATTRRHQTQLIVLETHQQNNQQQLKSIHEDTKDIREKVDQLVMVMLERK